MTRAAIHHGGSSLGLVGLLIDDKAVVGDHSSDFVLLLLTANEEDLVVDLDARKVFGEVLSIPQANSIGGLGGQLVDHQVVAGIVVIVETRLVLGEDEVRLKTHNIMEEASELIDLTSDDNVRA